MNTPADYIRAYMPERPVDRSRAALVMIDMQYATCSRQGALARKLQADRSSQTACPKPANKNPRPKGRGIGIPGTEEGTPQAAGNLPALIQASALAISDVSKG